MRLRQALRAREKKYPRVLRGSRANAWEIMAEGALRKEWEIFWFERLNKHQEEVLRLVVESKRDTSVNLPTGFGKSVVLQALSVQGHPTTVYCKIFGSRRSKYCLELSITLSMKFATIF